jgi:HAD superfamily hydrolase (TIGR01549 family)
MIKAIVFDCFGLFFDDPVFEYVLDPNSPSAIAKELDEMDDSSSRGEITKKEFVARAAELLNQPEDDLEKRFFHSTKRNEDLIDLSQFLRKDYRIALLSNIGADMMGGFFSQRDLEELFDVAIISGAIKIAKPDPRIFRIACLQLGVSPDEAVMVDDVEEYCQGARSIGMQAIHYENFGQFKQELQALL